MQLHLAGRAALVTGAAGGIGAATASALAAEGARLALVDRDAAALAGVADGLGAFAIVADLTVDAEVEGAVAEAVARLGGLDVVVHAAGVSGPVGTALADTTTAAFAEVVDVNVTGAFRVLRAALPALRDAAAPVVVLVASDSAVVAAPGMAPYAASKAALVQLGRALAVEEPAVRVVSICPSIVDTAMSRGDLDLPDGFDGALFPVLHAAEAADQIVLLASPRSRGVSGTSLLVDFGFSARSTFPA